MNFYLKSPYGNLNLDNVERCLRARVSLFMLKQQGAHTTSDQLTEDVKKNFDCLVMGSSYDIVGHFLLRLLIIYSSQMKDFLIENEIDLFKERLDERIELSNFTQSCRITLRHIRDLLGIWTRENSNEKLNFQREKLHRNVKENQMSSKKSQLEDTYLKYIMTLKLFCKSLQINQVAQHLMDVCNDGCTKYHITVPFQTCLNLVSKRKVHLKKGNANIFCSNWKEALHEIFEYFLIHNITKLRSTGFTSNYLQDDVRMTLLFKEIKHSYLKFESNESFSDSNDQSMKIIKHDQVDKESECFPPCISNVHTILKKIHRLKHNDRFYYSLFLKSIGMSLSESILFWKEEYSKVSCCTSVCSHSWHKNERKYIYGIRHLYGLEGGRKRYSPPDCQTLQGNMHISNLDHACPFLYNSSEALLQSLSPKVTSNPEAVETMLNYRQTHTPSESCQFYMSKLTGVYCGFDSPTGYYFAMKYTTQEGIEPGAPSDEGEVQNQGQNG